MTAPDCKRCGGDGSVFVHDFEDGFERNHRWERCDRCNGTGEEPVELVKAVEKLHGRILDDALRSTQPEDPARFRRVVYKDPDT